MHPYTPTDIKYYRPGVAPFSEEPGGSGENSKVLLERIEQRLEKILSLSKISQTFSTKQFGLTTVRQIIIPSLSIETAYIITVVSGSAYIGGSGVLASSGYLLSSSSDNPFLIESNTEIWGISNATGATITVIQL